jgi:hypothetical protein
VTRNSSLSQGVLLRAVLAGSLIASNAFSQTSSEAIQNAVSPAAKAAAGATASRYQPNKFSRRAGLYYRLEW